MRGGYVDATVDGEAVRVPESWLSGFCRPKGGLPDLPTEAGVRYWASQRRLQLQHETEQAASLPLPEECP
jgi:hypothetical protein